MTRSFSAALLALTVLCAPGLSQAERLADPSTASLMVSTLVVLAPVSVIAAGSTVVDHSFKSFSAALKGETSWTVTKIEDKEGVREFTLKARNAQNVLTLSVPLAHANTTNVQVRSVLTAKPLGENSYVFTQGATTLGVLVSPDAGLTHSRKRP
jgi:hypothetical protein